MQRKFWYQIPSGRSQRPDGCVFSRPPFGGIDDRAGGFAQDRAAVLRLGNDLAKLWPLVACKGP
ncbi:hypothetical protein EDS67_14920 [candidate division KSB1 bacterium]|nr:MAG: hypothetical protein EDS67_14920 [candidate division KSB1 bacterium]MCE7940934.1 hypothetical protein [Chlorobi bacterium CHB1]MDL1875021.1 hypothetical protein [Cytophagia bacterium CHB2]